ncbi:hypothetical protein [Rodentibacter genomosp. 2]|uniref:hypothetical protein n=1 Tax=Rodentibacter genomosp. 2 TaxID=1908266 RepID=UPI001FC988F0
MGNASVKRKIVNVDNATLSNSSTEVVTGQQLYATNTAVSTAQSTATAASRAQSTAMTASTVASTAQSTANVASSTATAAQSTANAASTAVSQVSTALNTKADSSRVFTFNIENGSSDQASNSGQADQWTLAKNDSLTFGATSDLTVSTDSSGKIVYGFAC